VIYRIEAPVKTQVKKLKAPPRINVAAAKFLSRLAMNEGFFKEGGRELEHIC